jgi:hypothetical protein
MNPDARLRIGSGLASTPMRSGVGAAWSVVVIGVSSGARIGTQIIS